MCPYKTTQDKLTLLLYLHAAHYDPDVENHDPVISLSLSLSHTHSLSPLSVCVSLSLFLPPIYPTTTITAAFLTGH